MCPRLFQIGPFTVYGYGLMLALGFIAGSYLLTSEYNRRKINLDITPIFITNARIFYVFLIFIFFVTFILQNSGPNGQSFLDFFSASTLHILLFVVMAVSGLFLLKKQKKGSFDLANSITIIALFYGVAGSKVLYVIENFSDFLSRPFETMFSPGGLTFYGGFLLVVVSIYFTTRKAGVPFFVLTDATVPGLMLGYGIARIGCHLAGDGDYGFPTTLPWGTDYSNGTYPPSIAFKDFPEITSKFPGGIVPDNTPCHPTPVYEFIICALIFWFLWSIRKKTAPAGKLFMMYLIFAGIERFAIEFLRPNPRILFGISEAQLIALALIALGLLGWWKFKTGSRITTAV